MEEELVRPAEKVVNMSVAPGERHGSSPWPRLMLTLADGSRVEAKTPEGTRVVTPNQAAGNIPGPSGSGTVTPRTGSYAGAVKTAPSDWHLDFYINGQRLSLEDTIYGAVHRNQQPAASGTSTPAAGSLGVFSMPVTIKFRKVEGPAPASTFSAMPPTGIPLTGTEATYDAPSPASIASALPAALEPSAPTSKILRLLRVVHNLSVEGRELAPNGDTQLDENLFVNNKLTAKLTRQLEETMIIARSVLASSYRPCATDNVIATACLTGRSSFPSTSHSCSLSRRGTRSSNPTRSGTADSLPSIRPLSSRAGPAAVVEMIWVILPESSDKKSASPVLNFSSRLPKCLSCTARRAAYSRSSTLTRSGRVSDRRSNSTVSLRRSLRGGP